MGIPPKQACSGQTDLIRAKARGERSIIIQGSHQLPIPAGSPHFTGTSLIRAASMQQNKMIPQLFQSSKKSNIKLTNSGKSVVIQSSSKPEVCGPVFSNPE